MPLYLISSFSFIPSPLPRTPETDMPRSTARSLSSVSLADRVARWRLFDRMWAALSILTGTQDVQPGGRTLRKTSSKKEHHINFFGLTFMSSNSGVADNTTSAMGPNDKATRQRCEHCVKVVCRLVLFYLYDAELEATSACLQQFSVIYPVLLQAAGDSETMRNHAHYLLWSVGRQQCAENSTIPSLLRAFPAMVCMQWAESRRFFVQQCTLLFRCA